MVTYLTPIPILDPYSMEQIGEDWSDPSRTEAPNAFVLGSRTSSPPEATRDHTNMAWTLYIPVGEEEPGRLDRIEFGGSVFIQDGRPIREMNPFTGWDPYATVNLTRDEG